MQGPSAFAPADEPRVAIASDGTLAAIHEPARVVVVELPGCAPFAEIAIGEGAAVSDVAWVGAPPRLVVLAQRDGHAVVQLVDPYGPRVVAELRIDGEARLAGTVGAHALVLGPTAATVVTAGATQLAAYPFPARGGDVPAVAGAGAGAFIVALPAVGALEEWDPHARIPKRRLKLPRAGAVAACGGNDRLAWCTWQDAPTCIDVLPLVPRGEPRMHELPEPIAAVAAHPRSDLLVCLGADSGRIYVVDLDGRRGLRVVGPEHIDRADAVGLVTGRIDGVLAAQQGRPVAVVALELERPQTEEEPARFAEPAPGPAPEPRPSAPVIPARDWREDLVTWARTATASPAFAGEPPPAPALDHVLTRFDLPPALRPVLALLYGLHLAGEPGAAPIDVARIARGWPEALGRGSLAARGAAVYESSRVRLSPALQRALDDA